MSYSLIRKRALPPIGEVKPRSLYFIQPSSTGPVAVHISDADGNLFPCFDDQKIVDAFILFSRPFGEMHVFNTLAERDEATITHNALVFVLDTTGDASVPDGNPAFYFYMKNNNQFVVFNSSGGGGGLVSWDNIQGKPNVSVSEIEDAVRFTHRHENKGTLDKLTEENERLRFDGKPVNEGVFVRTPSW